MQTPHTAAGTIQELHQHLAEELKELTELQQEISTKTHESVELKTKIQQLLKELEMTKHQSYMTDAELPKLKSRLQTVQREKLAIQNDLNKAQSFTAGWIALVRSNIALKTPLTSLSKACAGDFSHCFSGTENARIRSDVRT